jgi:hypothetical protein
LVYGWQLWPGTPYVFRNGGKRPEHIGIFDRDLNRIAVISAPPRTEIEVPALEDWQGESSIIRRPFPIRRKSRNRS